MPTPFNPPRVARGVDAAGQFKPWLKNRTLLSPQDSWQILMDPESPEETLSQLYGSRKYEVMGKLAAHPNTSDKKLLELAKLGKPKRVYEMLARRSSLSKEAQLAFYQHEPYLMITDSNFPVDQDILCLAIRDNDADMLDTVSLYRQLDAKNYALLAKRVRDEDMPRSILVGQTHCPRGDVESIVASVTDGHRWGYECMTLYRAVSNPNLSYLAAMTILDKAFTHKDALLAERVAEHESDVVSAAALERSEATVYVEMRKAIDRGVARRRAQEEKPIYND
jgi:hypothetical protein